MYMTLFPQPCGIVLSLMLYWINKPFSQVKSSAWLKMNISLLLWFQSGRSHHPLSYEYFLDFFSWCPIPNNNDSFRILLIIKWGTDLSIYWAFRLGQSCQCYTRIGSILVPDSLTFHAILSRMDVIQWICKQAFFIDANENVPMANWRCPPNFAVISPRSENPSPALPHHPTTPTCAWQIKQCLHSSSDV